MHTIRKQGSKSHMNRASHCDPETQILLLSESRPHAFWKKSNSQKMGKTDHVYEARLQSMTHLRVWVFIQQRNQPFFLQCSSENLSQLLLVWLFSFRVIVLESSKPIPISFKTWKSRKSTRHLLKWCNDEGKNWIKNKGCPPTTSGLILYNGLRNLSLPKTVHLKNVAGGWFK